MNIARGTAATVRKADSSITCNDIKKRVRVGGARQQSLAWFRGGEAAIKVERRIWRENIGSVHSSGKNQYL